MRHAVRQRRTGIPSRWKTSGLTGSRAGPPSRQGLGNGRRDGEDASHQRLRAGRREPDDDAGHIDLVPGEAEDFILAPAGVVGEVEDVLPRGGQVGADGEVLGVLEEALAGGILAEAVGEAGHGVEPAPVDGERAHAVEGRGLPVDGAGGGPGGAPGELVLADLVRGERGGPCIAAEEGGEMGDPAAGGALGPELPDLVVLEVGVAEISQGRPLGAKRARRRYRRAWVTGGGGRAGLVRGHGLDSSLWWRPRADGVRPHSLWWARQASGMCEGEGTAMCPVADALMRGRHGANEKMRIVLEELRGEERLAMRCLREGVNPNVYDRRPPQLRGAGINGRTSAPPEMYLPDVCSFWLPLTHNNRERCGFREQR